MEDKLTLLVDDPLAIRIILLWPQVPLTEDGLPITELGRNWYVARQLSLDVYEVREKLNELQALGVLKADRTVDKAVVSYIERLGLAKTAGLGAFDPERVAAKFLADMDLEERMDWLAENGLLEEV